jgi:hypothetical protein
MKFRSFLTILAAIAGVLFLTSTIGFAWILAQSPIALLRGSPLKSPTAAMFVPRQAPVVASLLVNPDRLETLRQVLAKPGDRKDARAELEQFKQGILGSSDLDYNRDVQPWLGTEITAAITALDIDRDSANGEERGYLLALMTKNPERSREFLQLFWQKRALAGTDLEFERYKGTQIIYGKVEGESNKPPKTNLKKADLKSQPASPRSLATAVVGDRYVLFANSPKVLKDSINNVQAAELNLASSPDYQRAIATLKEDKIGLIVLNLPQLTTLTGENAPQDGNLAISLSLSRQGLIAETAIIGRSTSEPAQASLSKPVQALQYIPANSPLVAAGIHLDRLWTSLSDTPQGSGASKLGGADRLAQLFNQPLKDLEKQWKIDLKDDVFSWVTGEYALGLVPRLASDKTQPKDEPLDWVFVADTSNASAQAAIDRLDAKAKEQGISTGSLKLGDQTVEVWTRLATADASKPDGTAIEAQVTGVHTSVGKYEIFATSVEAMEAVLNAQKNTLANSRTFERAIAPIRTPNNGYFYIDWDKAQPVLKTQFPFIQFVELAGQPLFEHLRSLTVSSYGTESGVQHGGAFIQLN